jgi:hypothetical protein
MDETYSNNEQTTYHCPSLTLGFAAEGAEFGWDR